MKFDNYGAGIAKGLTVTMKNLLRSRVTTQYPEQRLSPSRRTRGNQLIWNRDKCTGCSTCARTCPQGVIQISTSVDPVENKYVVEKYEVDTGYCIFCGLCVESCPYGALFLGYAYERAKHRRNELVQSKEDMMLESGKKRPSGYFYPEIAEELPRQTLLVERITEEA